MIFLRHFYDEKRKVNTGHKWVWGVHFISYSVIIYYYFFTDSVDREASESSKIWIPLDILLTVNIAIYQIFFNFLQRFENLMEAESDEHSHGHDDHEVEKPETEMTPVDKNTPLMEGYTEASSEQGRLPREYTGESEMVLEHQKKQKELLMQKFKCLSFAKKTKEEPKESIYNTRDDKVKEWKLLGDSACMGFAVFLKEDILGMNFSDEQRSDVFQNSLIVVLIQSIMILCVWKYAFFTVGKDAFAITPAKTLDMMVARFIASMMMHINVEKDVRAGITIMKYVVNHYDNFTNAYPAFFIGFM